MGPFTRVPNVACRFQEIGNIPCCYFGNCHVYFKKGIKSHVKFDSYVVLLICILTIDKLYVACAF